MKLYTLILTVATAISLSSCASISAPEGGRKDTTPPILLNSIPANQQLNVTGKSVSLTFDEWVQVKNLNRELLITPNTKNPYKVKSDKETITLEFEKPLQENTTYTLNFREGLMDITESNKPKNLKLSFSTGSFIDSSKVAGTVVDMMTQQPEKDAVVALYPAGDTLNIREDPPYYQAQTDSAGRYTFENIKEGEYRMYALIDKNKNAFYDNENEKIGYLSTTVHITPTTEPVTLQTVRVDTKSPILMQRQSYTDRFVASYSEGIQRFSARPLQQQTDSLYYKQSKDGKLMQLFKTPQFAGGKTILAAVDSSGNMKVDTVQIDFQGKRAQLIKGAQLKVTNTGNTTYREGQTVTLELETPVNISGNTPVSLMADSVLLQTLTPDQLQLDPSRTELSFKLPALKTQQKQISIALDSAAIVPIEGAKLRFGELPLTLAETSGTGTVKGKVETNASAYTIQLLTPQYVPIAEVKDKKAFTFAKIEPGKYLIRVLVDTNNNGIFDKPDPKLEKPLDKVYIYPQPITVRANWDLEDIKLEF
ncbi:Ig-like domain-containing domain [Pontibacter chitinilyticus]|uniref:Ig-like domain-containing domain n=1 Tax=Pontibacter chitinilyticus TaxID=2674989 RepID=UPI00321A7869